jgi:hypothetical protein
VVGNSTLKYVGEEFTSKLQGMAYIKEMATIRPFMPTLKQTGLSGQTAVRH